MASLFRAIGDAQLLGYRHGLPALRPAQSGQLASETIAVQRMPSTVRILLFAAMGIGLVARLHCLLFPYLWLDECTTLWCIRGGNLAEMLDRALHWTASGPLFLLWYRLSCDVAGDADWALKLPGIFCGVSCIWATYWSSRKLFSRDDVSLAAAWLVSIEPHFVAFSQEARPYMAAALLVTLAMGWLAAWLESGRRLALAAAVLLSVAAVGFHLLTVLVLLAHHAAVLHAGLRKSWPWRRWMEWLVAHLIAGCCLWVVGIQFRLLSSRQGSMIVETKLPMVTRWMLDDELLYELRIVIVCVLVGMLIWQYARRFPNGLLLQGCAGHGPAVSMAAATYAVPAALVSLLAAMRALDSWPRYYFLFYPGLMIALAWVVVCVLPRRLATWLAVAIGLAMLCQYHPIAGVPACRLNPDWLESAQALSTLRGSLGRNDLMISRAGLIEANDMHFLHNPTGVSYLKCFMETKGDPLLAEHIPLPFSAESNQTRQYLETLVREKLLGRADFWLVNVGPLDFDYRDWVRQRLGGEFRQAAELRYATLVLCHYVRNTEGGWSGAANK